MIDILSFTGFGLVGIFGIAFTLGGLAGVFIITRRLAKRRLFEKHSKETLATVIKLYKKSNRNMMTIGYDIDGFHYEKEDKSPGTIVEGIKSRNLAEGDRIRILYDMYRPINMKLVSPIPSVALLITDIIYIVLGIVFICLGALCLGVFGFI